MIAAAATCLVQHPENIPAKPSAAGRTGVWLEIVTGHDDLLPHVPAWQELATTALEINAFYEPGPLLAAAKHVHQDKDLLFVFVYQAVAGASQPQLIGLFPLERRHRFRGLPLTMLRLWEYDYCYLCTPLLRRECGRLCWNLLFDWMTADSQHGSLLEMAMLPAEGPVSRELVEVLRRRGLLTFEMEKYTRAWFQRASDAETYVQQSLSSSKRLDLRRKWRRLEELGHIELRHLKSQDDLQRWIHEFLQLEASGWKRLEGTAIACKPQGPEYLDDICRSLFAAGKLHMLGLFLNDEPIALRCNFLSAPGSFFFKPAYNEEYAKYSPGVHLEIETIRALHADSSILWMDSCTSPDNTLLNGLWHERRTYQTLHVAVCGIAAPLLLSVVQPALRWANRTLGRYRKIAD